MMVHSACLSFVTAFSAPSGKHAVPPRLGQLLSNRAATMAVAGASFVPYVGVTGLLADRSEGQHPYRLHAWGLQRPQGLNAVVLNSNQPGGCGGSFAYVHDGTTVVEMLEARLAIRTGGRAADALSVASITRCSPLNQGCAGGYPFLAAKHAAERGVQRARCFPDEPSADAKPPHARCAACAG